MVEFFKDHDLEKLQSRLRVIANGDSEVNAIRSEHVGALRVRDQQTIKNLKVGERRAEDSRTQGPTEASDQAPKVEKLEELSDDIEASVFITMERPLHAAYARPDRVPEPLPHRVGTPQ